MHTAALMKNYLTRLMLSRRDIWRDKKGVAVIEAALVFPLLLLLCLGGFELGMLVMTHSRINQVGLGVADNASRIGASTGDVREVDISEVFTGASHQLKGMPFVEKGRIILSSLERKSGTTQWFRWQRCYGNLAVASQYGNAGQNVGQAIVLSNGSSVSADADTAIMLVEIFYDYEPMFMPNLFPAQRFHSTFAFNVREQRNLSANNNTGIIESQGTTPRLC